MKNDSVLLVRGGRIIDQSSPFHLQQVDLLIVDGRIKTIAKSIDEMEANVIDADGYYIGSGWCDIGAHCGEPGEEVHETIDSLCQAAQRGGYTKVAVLSNNTRPFDNRHIVADTKSRATHGVDVIPMPSVTKLVAGQELAEMLDMKDQTSPLFSDGYHRAFDNAMLCKALEYAGQFDGMIMTIPGSSRSLKNGQVNESAVSAQMGLPGLPGYEEVATLSAELSLASYSKAPFFAHLLSLGESVEQIKFRKEQGLDTYASVSSMHIAHTEADVSEFNENFKILPPLRRESDRLSLISGLREGTIDMVVSNHKPISSEQKDKEFGESPFGAIGLETTFLSLASTIEDLTAEEVNAWLAINPRRALNIAPAGITEGESADLTLFSLDGATAYSASKSRSQSKNSPYAQQSFRGKVLGTINGKNLYLSN